MKPQSDYRIRTWDLGFGILNFFFLLPPLPFFLKCFQNRLAGPGGVGIFGFGEGQVQVGQGLHHAHNTVGDVAHQGRERGEDAPDFLALGELLFAPLVVQLHRRQRLDEQRGAGGRLVVHNGAAGSWDSGRNEPAVSLGDDRLLQHGDDFRGR